jgi:hypothetical protein
LESLSLHLEPSSGGIEASKSLKEDEAGVTLQNLSLEGDVELYGQEYQELERTVEILRGRTIDSSWTVGSSGSIEKLRLSVYQHSQAQEE